MKKLLLILMFLVMIITPSFAGTENSTADVREHYAAGAVIAGLTTYYLPKDMHPGWRWAAGVAAGMAAGAAKECIWDKNPDATDWSQWAGGAFIGATIISITF